MSYFNIVAQTSENTVVTEYVPVVSRSDSYQSEAEPEQIVYYRQKQHIFGTSCGAMFDGRN